MTDKAKELNELANRMEQRGLYDAKGGEIWRVVKSEEDAIIAALRLAATLEEFGKADDSTLWKRNNGLWTAFAYLPADLLDWDTPIEAMRAAIDAAKPKPHEHAWSCSCGEFRKVWMDTP